MSKFIFKAVGIAAVAAFFCIGCSELPFSGDGEDDTATTDSIKNPDDPTGGGGGCNEGDDKITIKREGPSSVTLKIGHPNPDSAEGGFDIWMGRSATQGMGVVSFTVGSTVEAVLYQGATPYIDQNNMPPAGNYIIRYTASKLKCGTETDTTRVSEDRMLLVEQYIADDPTMPEITFACQTEYKVALGQSVTFNDAGCASANPGSTLTRTPSRDSPLVLQIGDNRTVTYTACKDVTVGGVTKNECVNLTKTIVVMQQPTIITSTPVIVLDKYTYNIDGTPFSSPDTAFVQSGTYVEKGVSEAYYLDENGVKVSIDKNLVNITQPDTFRIITPGNNVRYTLDADPAGLYTRASVNRTVYITEGCSGTSTISFTFLWLSGTGSIGSDSTLTIPANQPWTLSEATRTFRVRERDGDGSMLSGYNFGIDFGTLNPDNPQPGTYKITYIALSVCSGSALRFVRSEERTVIVE